MPKDKKSSGLGPIGFSLLFVILAFLGLGVGSIPPEIRSEWLGELKPKTLAPDKYLSSDRGSPLPSTTSAETAPSTPQDPVSHHLWRGIPVPHPSLASGLVVLANTSYISGYSRTLRSPLWVAYRADPNPGGKVPPRPEGFVPDPRIPNSPKSSDFNGTGYDRGHLAPNYATAILHGRIGQMESFFMTNVIPQLPSFNQGWWAKLEQRIIHTYTRRYGTIHVIAGPVFNPPMKPSKHLPSGIPIPDACFMILVDPIPSGSCRALAFIASQETRTSDSLASRLVPLAEVERRTGFKFFPNASAEEQVAIFKPATEPWP
jgi:endonuclease G